MLNFVISPVEIALRSLSVYLFLLLVLRLAGKREIGQMTPFDFVVVLVISNAVQNAMIGPDVSLVGGLTAAATLIVVNYALAFLRGRLPWLERVAEGTPTVLVHDGKFLMENLRRERVAPEEVLMAMREHGISEMEKVKLAVLEVDGTLSMIPVDAPALHSRRHFRPGHARR